MAKWFHFLQPVSKKANGNHGVDLQLRDKCSFIRLGYWKYKTWKTQIETKIKVGQKTLNVLKVNVISCKLDQNKKRNKYLKMLFLIYQRLCQIIFLKMVIWVAYPIIHLLSYCHLTFGVPLYFNKTQNHRLKLLFVFYFHFYVDPKWS